MAKTTLKTNGSIHIKTTAYKINGLYKARLTLYMGNYRLYSFSTDIKRERRIDALRDGRLEAATFLAQEV